ncbi:MAG: class I SAM-dependent methyltransferase [Acidobacteriota bacterium]
MVQAYKEDLAYIHHTGFAGFINEATPGLFKILGDKNITGGLIIDLGCGSGIFAKALTDAGYEALGIDISAAMIALAKRTAPRATFKKASLLKTKLPPCAAVTCVSEGLNYLFDEHGKAERLNLFKRIYEALAPGGVFVFDVLGPGSLTGANPQRTYTEGKGWMVCVEKEEDSEANQLTRRITTFRKVGNHWRRSDETHRIHLFAPGDLADELRQAGFQVKIIRAYGELKFRKGLNGFIARKK